MAKRARKKRSGQDSAPNLGFKEKLWADIRKNLEGLGYGF